MYASKIPSSDHIRSYLPASQPAKSLPGELPSTSGAIRDNAAAYGQSRRGVLLHDNVDKDQPGSIRDRAPIVRSSQISRPYAGSTFNDDVYRSSAVQGNASGVRSHYGDRIPHVHRPSSRAEYVPPLSYTKHLGESSIVRNDDVQREQTKHKTLSNEYSRNNSAANDDDDRAGRADPNEQVLRYQARALSRQKQTVADNQERTAGFISARDRPSSQPSENAQSSADTKDNGGRSSRSSKLSVLKSQSFPPYETIDKFIPSRSKQSASMVTLPRAKTTPDTTERVVGDRPSSRSKHLSGSALPARSKQDLEQRVSTRASKTKHLSGSAVPTTSSRASVQRSADLSAAGPSAQETSRLRQSNLSLESRNGPGVDSRRPDDSNGHGRSSVQTLERQYPISR